VTISTLTRCSRRGPRGPGRHLLADGFDLVFDFEKSHGAWLHDARSGRDYLDFVTFIASNPIGYNHPG
jgi:L-lysine 6-transaminase